MVEKLVAEVAVVGAGPAGIAAACRAAESGARVLLLDENPRVGGQIWRGASRG
ncbi:MAG: FAD-dependent oxidoreductase, partial [Thermoanaerobaculia bacterium]